MNLKSVGNATFSKVIVEYPLMWSHVNTKLVPFQFVLYIQVISIQVFNQETYSSEAAVKKFLFKLPDYEEIVEARNQISIKLHKLLHLKRIAKILWWHPSHLQMEIWSKFAYG